MGPERLLGRHLARSGRRRGGRRRLDRRPARPPGTASRAASSRAPRARTRPRSPRRGTTCSPRPGWDVERDGLAGAPPLRVVAGGERHVTIDRSLRLLGIGTSAVVARPRRRSGPDATRRAAREELARATAPDDRLRSGRQREHGRVRPVAELADACAAAGAWLHVDGAFGLWAAASPKLRQLVDGVRPRRLVGDGRPQVAERPLRLRARLLPPRGVARARDGRRRELPPARRRPEPVRLGARVVAARTRLRRLGGPPLAGAQRRRGARRPLLRPRARASPSCSARSRASRS